MLDGDQVVMITAKRPFTIGFFSYLAGPGHDSEIYPNVVHLFQLAEEVGLDKVWVAQHHFGHHGGLPSPFVLFSAVAAQTERLGFGTAILSLPYEHPVRLAEDAAVFETLFPNRLDIGFGTGFGSDAVMTTFGIEGEVRREIYEERLPQVLAAFDGSALNDADDRLYPAAPALRQRIWESPSRVEGAIDAAKRGNGLLLSRVAIGQPGIPTDVVQRHLVDAYLANLPEGIAPKLGLSRTVYPSLDPEAAYRDLTASLQAARIEKPNPETLKMTIDEELEHFSVHWGTPAQVAVSLAEEPLIDEITDLIFQVQPGRPDFETTREIIRLVATEVGPALGWVPSHEAVLTKR